MSTPDTVYINCESDRLCLFDFSHEGGAVAEILDLPYHLIAIIVNSEENHFWKRFVEPRHIFDPILEESVLYSADYINYDLTTGYCVALEPADTYYMKSNLGRELKEARLMLIKALEEYKGEQQDWSGAGSARISCY